LTPVPGFDGDGILPLFVYFIIYSFLLLIIGYIFIGLWPLSISYSLYKIYITCFKSYTIYNDGGHNVWADDNHRRPIGSKGYYYDNDQYIHYQIILPSYLNQIKYYFNHLKSSNLSLIFNFKLINQYDFYPIFLKRFYNWTNIQYTTLYIEFVDLANLRAQISKLYSLDRFNQNYFQEIFLTTNLSVHQDIVDAKKYLQYLLTLKTKKEN
jgi:hypothetical protein